MRYHLFTFNHHYPQGAPNDYEGSFDSPEEADAFIAARKYGGEYNVLMVQNAEGNLVVVETEEDE